MATEIELCALYACIFNQNCLCKKAFITIDDEGTCDFKATQKPLPEPEK